MVGKRVVGTAFGVGGAAWTWFCITNLVKTLEWRDEDEPAPFGGARDYCLYEQISCLGLNVKRKQVGMFRFQSRADQAGRSLLGCA